jgi:hypothetical protein
MPKDLKMFKTGQIIWTAHLGIIKSNLQTALRWLCPHSQPTLVFEEIIQF